MVAVGRLPATIVGGDREGPERAEAHAELPAEVPPP